MHVSRIWYLALGLASVAATACSPQRALQKYSYLTEKTGSNAPPADAEAAAPAAARDPQAREVIRTAMSYKGTPYKYGGTSRKGMDCSGLVFTSFQSVGKTLPRSSSAMAQAGKAIQVKQAQPGDLLFFASNGGTRINHVGLVVSARRDRTEFIHATTKDGVRTDILQDGYWDKRFRKAVTVF
ncbi:MAG: C40 family peptidase [Bacteroidia bacterium]|nr:C40 family peptidase [Bacteroidia bacterium]